MFISVMNYIPWPYFDFKKINFQGPQYVCTNFWTFVCMTCSGIHREFTHRVKSVSMSKFTSQEVEALQEGGNQRARETFLRDWDPREQRLPDNSNVDKVRNFIKSVYVDKKFFSSKASGKPPRDTLVNLRIHEDETRRASSYHSYSQSPPYDYQYEERRYGKQAPALTKKPGSDRGMLRILSTSRLSDHVQEDRFANEVASARVSDFSVTNGGDLFRSGTQSPPSLSHSSGSGKFEGLDLFSEPNQPQSAISAPFAEPAKFDGLDLFSAPNPQSTTSAPFAEPRKFDGLDLSSAPNRPQSATSATSAEPGRFDGLDLFTAPNAPQSVTSAPFAVPGKFDGLDLFSAPNAPQAATYAPSTDLFELSAASSASIAPTLSLNQEFKSFEPSLDLFTVMPQQQSTGTLNDKSTDMLTQKNEGWATFDTVWQAQPSQQDVGGSVPSSLTSWNGGVHDIGAPVNVKNNNQSWSSFEESTVPFESIYTKSSEQVPVQDPLVADPFLAWGISEDGARSHGLDIKSCNPFDLPSEDDHESSNISFDMSHMQSALPNHNLSSSPWFSESAAIPFTPGDSQDTLVFMISPTTGMQIPNIRVQGPVATSGGNPFA
ncbi:hypothetical protein M8C21_007246 [Ambrosia artemisiifolia]|uniref:Arf-GAP domain-containing protein n=1 Tax=Ambrosia artemisiifolia TaxID=4212 RepID=A0AAD5GAE4_AMBAR|nr:hypothetical protein M8C21_007246 [Ambrosia artemisiifolia]